MDLGSVERAGSRALYVALRFRDAHRPGDILPDLAEIHRSVDDHRQMREHLARHRPREVGQKLETQFLDHRLGQLGQLLGADPRLDMHLAELAVPLHRRSLKVVRFRMGDEQIGRLADRDTIPVMGMRSVVQFALHRVEVGIGIPFAIKLLAAALAGSVTVVTLPCGLFALGRGPGALADACHFRISRELQKKRLRQIPSNSPCQRHDRAPTGF